MRTPAPEYNLIINMSNCNAGPDWSSPLSLDLRIFSSQSLLCPPGLGAQKPQQFVKMIQTHLDMLWCIHLDNSN